MSAVGVGAELNFVNRKKLDLPIDQHRFADASNHLGSGNDAAGGAHGAGANTIWSHLCQ